MAKALIVILFSSILATGWYLANRGVWGVSTDLQSVRTGSAGMLYYGTRSVK